VADAVIGKSADNLRMLLGTWLSREHLLRKPLVIEQTICFGRVEFSNGSYDHDYARTRPQELEIPADSPHLVGVHDAHSPGLFSLLADCSSGGVEVKDWGRSY
jgi:hypothetical protein